MDEISAHFGRLRSGPFSRGALFDPSTTAYDVQSPSTTPAGFVDDLDQYITDFIHFRLYNGAFWAGPPQGTGTTLDATTNPLPGWGAPINVSGSAFTGSWETDTDSPSGHNFRIHLAPGAASDECYVEQITPISGWRVGLRCDPMFANILTVAGLANVRAEVKTQYLRVDKTTAVGSEIGGALGPTLLSSVNGTLETHHSLAVTNGGDAYYLRVRVHFTRHTASTSGTGAWDITDVRNTPAIPGDIVLPDAVDAVSYGIGGITQQSGGLSFWSGASSDGNRFMFLMPNGELLVSSYGVVATINPTISSNQNNYAPTDGAKAGNWYCNVSGATRTLTGIDATALGLLEGHNITIMPVNNDLVLAHASASSSAGNRFGCPNLANLTVRQGGGVTVRYLPTLGGNNAFRVIAP